MNYLPASLTRVASVALISAFLAAPCVAGKGKAPDFPNDEFRTNEDVARWLLVYDWMAWQSSDLVMRESEEELSKLGPEWFCLEVDGIWHAVYGRYERSDERYYPVFHYVYDDDSGFVPSSDPIEKELLARYGRAVRNGLDRMPEAVNNLGVRFNTYVRPENNDRLVVWILPAGQPDGTLIYGGDISYVFDATGSELVHEELNFTKFYATQPDGDLELDIDRQENDVPSVGDIFFLLSFRDQFASVTVWSRCSLTRMVDVEGQEAAWLHAIRERPECTKKAKKKRSKQNAAKH